MPLKAGDKCPAFSGTTAAEKISLKDLKGAPFVLYFYPKDDTSGCTAEACDFRDNIPTFKKLGVKVFGVSKDSLKSHEKFSEKYDLPFPLISDEDGKICDAFETWVEKSMYGRKYMGIERRTYLVDEKGIIRAIWPKVKVKGHVEDVLKEIKNL